MCPGSIILLSLCDLDELWSELDELLSELEVLEELEELRRVEDLVLYTGIGFFARRSGLYSDPSDREKSPLFEESEILLSINLGSWISKPKRIMKKISMTIMD